jgi:hypothetical protein
VNLTFKVTLDPKAFVGDFTKEASRLIREIAFGIEAQMKLLMTGPKTGREYVRRGRIHVASAPGEAPAVDFGNLINSIQTVIKSPTEAEITIGAEYAEVLEFEKDRPFVRPAIDGVLRGLGQGGILAGLRE